MSVGVAKKLSLGSYVFVTWSYVQGGAWHTMVGATFKGMCYMDGMCFAMRTPIVYISVCRKICGVIRGKGFAHVRMVSSIAPD